MELLNLFKIDGFEFFSAKKFAVPFSILA